MGTCTIAVYMAIQVVPRTGSWANERKGGDVGVWRREGAEIILTFTI